MADVFKKVVIGTMGVVAMMILAGKWNALSLQAANACGMQKNDTAVAFCETFDQPFPVTNRSGQLNGTLWGVSRLTGHTNLSGVADGWKPSTIAACNGNQPAQPDATDVIVCNGQVRETTNDNDDVTVLAMYPKQPFDFASRTGTVSFDVTNDTLGLHSAWPEFWLTDQPIPAPFTHGGPPCDFCSTPRNGLGIRFAGNFAPGQGPQAPNCPSDANPRWIVDSLIVVSNYVVTDIPMLTNSGWQTLGCAISPSGPDGPLNHIELRISQSQVEVWATDPGKTALQIMSRTPVNLAFTRGLVWMEDSHYNASKEGGTQTVHTFTWDNVAFDGPAPYRDLSFDVLDHLTSAGDGTLNLGWISSPGSPAQLNTLPMTAANISAARSALLMFNFAYENVTTFNYSINGNANTAPSPVGAYASGWRTIAVPVPLNQLVAGPQAIRLSGDQSMIIANANIVLVAAGTVPGVGPSPSTPSNLRIVPLLFAPLHGSAWFHS
jgi:hypothetical protein